MKISGVEVEDADESLLVNITKLDVKQGALKKANSCAAANALCRQTGATAARVHFSRAYLKQKGKWVRYCVPPALRNEILAFDRGGKFAPGEYKLYPVQPTVRLDAPSRSVRKIPMRKTGTHPKRGNRPKRSYHIVSGVRERMMADWE